MNKEEIKMDPKVWEEIQEQFNKIKEQAGIDEPTDEDLYQKDIEELLGFTYEEMDKEMNDMIRTVNLEVEVVDESATFPKYAYSGDSGFDLHSVEDVELSPFGRAAISTGLKLGIPESFEIQIRPKSGLALNQGLTVLNSPGTVDGNYTGIVKVIVFNTNNHSVKIPKGMKIGQAVLCPVFNGNYVRFEKVNNLGEKERGENGFGSTKLF